MRVCFKDSVRQLFTDFKEACDLIRREVFCKRFPVMEILCEHKCRTLLQQVTSPWCRE